MVKVRYSSLRYIKVRDLLTSYQTFRSAPVKLPISNPGDDAKDSIS